MNKVLVIDNYDSFTYNLVHMLRELNVEVTVKRNDQLTLEEVDPFTHLLLSPGPGIPAEAGLLLDIVKTYASTKNILGVCLGHQAIAEAFGGELENLDRVHHGVSTTVEVMQDDVLFEGIGSTFEAARYHSWVAAQPLADELEVTAQEAEGQIMALRHKTFNVRGVQFHPESILTPEGRKMLANWLGVPLPETLRPLIAQQFANA